MRRRELLIAMSASLVISARKAWAQPRSVRIGILSSASQSSTGERLFGQVLEVLRQAGWVEGQNLVIDWRYTNGKLELHEPLARELVALRPDLIFAPTQPAASAVQRVTSTIPIVFALAPEPVESGLALSLARPGRNATGTATMNAELIGKRLQLMRETFPGVRRIAITYQPDFDLNVRQAVEAERVAKDMGLELLKVPIGGPATFDGAFARLASLKPDATYVIENPGTFTHRGEVTRRVNALHIVAMYGLQEYTISGGLMSYSVSWPEQFHRAARYIVQILEGASAAGLPISQPTRFELVINLKTARALGVTIPQSILLRADRLIE